MEMTTVTLFFMEYFELFYLEYKVHWGINTPLKNSHHPPVCAKHTS